MAIRRYEGRRRTEYRQFWPWVGFRVNWEHKGSAPGRSECMGDVVGLDIEDAKISSLGGVCEQFVEHGDRFRLDLGTKGKTG